MAVVIYTVLYVRRKRRARREAEASRVTTFPPEEPAIPLVARSRAATAHELDSPEARAASPSAGQASGWPQVTARPPPAYDPHKAAPSPNILKQPPAFPLELPGSTYIHEHHPAFSAAGSSVGTPTEVTAGSPPRTPDVHNSPAVSSMNPRSENQLESPTFISPLGSPRVTKS